MRALVTADIHCTDKPRDRYRLGLFKWLAKQQIKYKTDVTFLLGDITNEKDRHPSALVNQLVEEITGLKPPIYILMGNHDYISEKTPFFNFLNCIEGVFFITEPTYLKQYDVALIPHCPTQEAFDLACAGLPHRPGLVFCHNTFTGAISEATGAQLSGLSLAALEAKAPQRAYSGDIHKPQKAGIVEYVGSPYHVRFGDKFEPRVLLLDSTGHKELYYECPRKWVVRITDPDDLLGKSDLLEGDQVKVVLTLTREEVVQWQMHKAKVLENCQKLNLEVFGVEMSVSTNTKTERVRLNTSVNRGPEEILKAFCTAEGVSQSIKDAGLALLKPRRSDDSPH